MVVVYSTPNCAACDATCILMNKYGVRFTKVDITKLDEDDDELISFYKFANKHQYKQFPIIYVSDEVHWSGLNPELIKIIRE